MSEYERCPYVAEVINRLKARSDEQPKGVVSLDETGNLLAKANELLDGKDISEFDRRIFQGYIELERCLTVAEANRIASAHSCVQRKKWKKDNAKKRGLV